MHVKLLRIIILLMVAFSAALVLISACAEDPVEPPPPAKPPQIPTSGLIAFYPFNGDALDASGNDNHGTVLGGATVPGYLTIGDNAVDRVTLPYTVLEGVGDFTVSVWARVTTLHASGLQTAVSGARAASTNDFLIYFEPPTNRWGLSLKSAGYAFGPDETIRDLGWHHVVMLRKGTIACMYLDNVQVGDSLTVTGAAIDLDAGGFLLGQDQDSVGGGFEAIQSWAGDLDNLRIYNRAVNPTEVRALFLEKGWGG